MFVQFFGKSRSLEASAQIGLGVAEAVRTIHKSGSGSREGSGSDIIASRGSGIAGLEVKVSVLEEVEGSGRWTAEVLRGYYWVLPARCGCSDRRRRFWSLLLKHGQQRSTEQTKIDLLKEIFAFTLCCCWRFLLSFQRYKRFWLVEVEIDCSVVDTCLRFYWISDWPLIRRLEAFGIRKSTSIIYKIYLIAQIPAPVTIAECSQGGCEGGNEWRCAPWHHMRHVVGTLMSSPWYIVLYYHLRVCLVGIGGPAIWAEWALGDWWSIRLDNFDLICLHIYNKIIYTYIYN